MNERARSEIENRSLDEDFAIFEGAGGRDCNLKFLIFQIHDTQDTLMIYVGYIWDTSGYTLDTFAKDTSGYVSDRKLTRKR